MATHGAERSSAFILMPSFKLEAASSASGLAQIACRVGRQATPVPSHPAQFSSPELPT